MDSELERLIGRAVLDPDFREKVLADPDTAAKSEGFDLSAPEQERLRSLIDDYRKTGWVDSIKDVRAIW